MRTKFNGYQVFPKNKFIEKFGLEAKDLHDDMKMHGTSHDDKTYTLIYEDDESKPIKEIVDILEDYLVPPVGAWDNIYIGYAEEDSKKKFYVFSLSERDVETIKMLSEPYKAMIKSKVKDFDILG